MCRCLCFGFRGRNQSTASPSQTRCVNRRLLQRDFVEAPKHVPQRVYVLPRPVLDLMARQINVRKIHHDGLAAVAVLAVEPRHTDLETMPARAEYTHMDSSRSVSLARDLVRTNIHRCALRRGGRGGRWRDRGERPVDADDLAFADFRFDFRVSCERRDLSRAPGNPFDHEPHPASHGVIIIKNGAARTDVKAYFHGNVGHEEHQPSRERHLEMAATRVSGASALCEQL